jgi:hypothetical protein
MGRLTAIENRDAHNASKVETTEEDRESEWELNNRQN